MRGWKPFVVALATLAVAQSAQAARRDDRPSLVLLSVTGGEGFTAAEVGTIEQMLLTAFDSTGCCRVIGHSDLSTLLSLEARKQAAGCSDTACMAEIAGALGADFVASADVGRIGTTRVLNLKAILVRTATVVARAQQVVKSDDELVAGCGKLAVTVADGISAAVAANAPPRPIPAGRVAAWTTLIAGVVVLAVGTGLGIASTVTNGSLHGTTRSGTTAGHEQDTANAEAMGANVTLPIGGVAAAVGLGLRVAF